MHTACIINPAPRTSSRSSRRRLVAMRVNCWRQCVGDMLRLLYRLEIAFNMFNVNQPYTERECNIKVWGAPSPLIIWIQLHEEEFNINGTRILVLSHNDLCRAFETCWMHCYCIYLVIYRTLHSIFY